MSNTVTMNLYVLPGHTVQVAGRSYGPGDKIVLPVADAEYLMSQGVAQTQMPAGPFENPVYREGA